MRHTFIASRVPRLDGHRLIKQLFFLSGLCSLLYEVLWLRFFTSLLGSSTQSMSAIVTAFLAGTALGGFAIGRHVDRIDSPLRLYALLELATGAIALVAFGFFFGLDGGGHFLAGSVPYTVEKWLLFATAFVFVAAPAALIGATLPVLSRLFITNLQGVSTHLGDLYAKHTLGAAMGAGLSVLLVAWVGYFYAYVTAVVLSVLIGVVALFLSTSKSAFLDDPNEANTGQANTAETNNEAQDEETAGSPKLKAGWVAVCMALSGFSALSFEVAWFRIAEYQWRGTMIGFGVLLACYLTGLSLGSKLVSRLRTSSCHERLFVRLQWAAGCAILASLPCALLLISTELVPAQLLTPFILLGVTTIFGAVFPIAGKLAVDKINVLGARVGLVYAANLLGAVLGSLATGFVLLPTLGTQTLLLVLPFFHFFVAVTVLVLLGGVRPRQIGLVAAGILGAFGLQRGPWMERYVLYATPLAQSDMESELSMLKLEETDIQALAVLETHDGERILLGGSNISGTTLRRHTQTVQSHLGMLMHPQPSRVLEIGYGVGELLKTIQEYRPDHVDLVEIDPRMNQVANDYFSAINHRASEDDNVTVHIMDGRRFLQRSSENYDLIMNDTMFLASEQSLRLYTVEHFRRARESLSNDGVMLVWLPLNMQDDAVLTVIRTFIAVFPRAYLWNPDSYPLESFLIGVNGDAPIDYATLAARFEHTTRPSVEMFGWTDPVHFLAGFRGDTAFLEQVAGDGPLHRDMKPTIDFAIGGTAETASGFVRRSPLFILDHLDAEAETKRVLHDQLLAYEATKQDFLAALPPPPPEETQDATNRWVAESASVCDRFKDSNHVIVRKLCAERLVGWANRATSPAIRLDRVRRALEFDLYNPGANLSIAEHFLSDGIVNDQVLEALHRLERLKPYSKKVQRLRNRANRLATDGVRKTSSL